MKIYQLVSALSHHDAVSNYTRQLDEIFRDSGYESKIFVNHLAPELQSSTIRPLSEFEQHINDPDIKVVYQYSVHDPASEYYLRAKGHKTFIYHNITPHDFFRGYNEPIAEICHRGRQMLPELASVTDQAITISDYSRQELINHGFSPDQVETIPFLLETQIISRKHQGLHRPNSAPLLLFVGKIAPHKKVEDTIKAFALYQKHYRPDATLHLVGALGKDRYETELRTLIADLNIQDQVIFHGRISTEKLHRLYTSADLFITMSEHEGFCVPLIEAMAYQIPIIAYAASATPDTLGDSAIQVTSKDPGILASTIDTIICDPSFTQQIVKSQSLRLQQFLPQKVRIRLQKKFDILSN